jgi:hypothetical protein
MTSKRIATPLETLLHKCLGTGVALGHPSRVEYTGRAFKQDSEQAIKNDPYLALIEAITNPDDNLGNRDGDIAVFVDNARRPWTLAVLDNGDGIAHTEIHDKLIKLGNRTSGLEQGKSARGNRGRGARDLASLGNVLFETIHNGWYSALAIDANGDVLPGEPVKVTSAVRERCGIKKNGTRVTITCKTAKKPHAATMARQLQSLVALRDIMQNPKRRITFYYGDNEPVPLRYEPPKDRKPIKKWTLAIAGYQGKATLALYQSPKPIEDDPRDIAREGGILIKGGRAVHESTLFDFEGNAAAKRLTGELTWDGLDKLIRDYDDEEEQGRNHNDSNPFPIVRRSRDGLDASHPAYKAMKNAARSLIAAEVKRLEQEMSRGTVQESEQTRKRFSALGDLLGKFWNSKREELDNNEEGGSDPNDRQPQQGFTIVPPRKRLDPSESSNFSVRLGTYDNINAPLFAELKIVLAEPSDAVTLSCATVELTPINDDAGSELHQYRGTFRLGAGDEVGEALVEARLNDATAALEVDVKPEKPVVPKNLEFEHDQYRLRPGKPKKIRVLAPAWLVLKAGDSVTLRSSSPSDIAVTKATVRLKPCGTYYAAETSLRGDRLNSKAKITAELGKVIAVTRAIVTDTEQRPKVEVKIDSIAGNQRAQIKKSDKGDITITINGSQPAAKRYLGEHPNYDLQNTIPACVLIAEIAGEEMVQFFLTEKHKTRQVDPITLQAQRVRELADLMPKIHQIMLPDRELRQSQLDGSAHGTHDESAVVA